MGDFSKEKTTEISPVASFNQFFHSDTAISVHYPKKEINPFIQFNDVPYVHLCIIILVTQVDASGFRKRVDPAGKSREIYWILQENIGIITGKWKQYSDRTFSEFFR